MNDAPPPKSPAHTAIDPEPIASSMAADNGFRHLHPLSIIMKSVSAIGQNLIAIAVLYFSVFDRNIVYTLLAAFLFSGFIIGVMSLIWWRFTYQVGAKEIRIKSGLLNRNNRSIPYDRIQDVSLEQKLISRILGLATVKLETGASVGEDGKLDALLLTDARALRDRLRDYKSGITAEAADVADSDHGDEKPEGEERAPLFAMDNRRIFIASLFNFSFILLAIMGAITQNLDFLIPEKMFSLWDWADEFEDQAIIYTLSATTRFIWLIGMLFSIIVVGMVGGIIRTFIREYGFRLDRVDTGRPGFRRRRGLFTLTDMVMPIHRVQAVIIQTGPIRSRFGWHHLKFQSLASDGSGERDHSVAPCAQMDEIDPILVETGIAGVTGDLQFHHVHSALWWRDAIIWVVVILAVSIANGMLLNPVIYGLSLLAIPVIAVKYLNWRHHLYALSATQLYVHQGWWRRKLTILPIRKIQSVDISQSPLDHPLGLATIIVGIAGGSVTTPLRINDIPVALAGELRTKLI